MLHRKMTAGRQGLTLMELVVVMMILVALAGILVPMIPSMLTRAHVSSTVTNLEEAAKAIQTYQTLNGTYPINWDALGTGTAMIDYFPNGTMCPAQFLNTTTSTASATSAAGGTVTPVTLTGGEASALTGVGITVLQGMQGTGTGAPAGFDPTFAYYPDVLNGTNNPATNQVSIAGGTVLAGIDPIAGGTGSPAFIACTQMGLSTTGRYVLLGIGPRCSIISKGILNAPVHFGDVAVLNPEYGYERFCAVFKVSDTNQPSFSQAVLVGVTSVEDSGVSTVDNHLQNWYQQSTPQ